MARIESVKTTSMEDVNTRVLEKIKNILEGKTEKWSDVSRQKLKIHYPLCQTYSPTVV